MMTNAELEKLIRASDAFKALADAGRDNELADAVAAVTPETIAKSFTAADIYAVLSPDSAIKLLPLAVQGITAAIGSQDRPGVEAWNQALATAGVTTKADVSAISGVLASTEQKPASIPHEQVSEVLNAIRPRGDFDKEGKFTASETGALRALPIKW